MKPICTKCARFFRCVKNDYPFVEGMQAGEGQKPYKLWFGDRWECEGCGASIVVGVAKKPLAEHYQESFQAVVDRYKPQLQVTDC